ncbi:MAG: hypothetical protein FGM18_02805 [Burkholderiaceae bacterium]|nr:hypothetical protein [Burkholderiaceae bacterium]
MDTRVHGPIPPELAQAIADDALTLAALHDRELTSDLIAALRESDFPMNLGLLPRTPEQRDCWQQMQQAVCALPDPITAAQLDDLAAEYAAIYLTGAYQSSPYESVWTDDEHLMCQASMFTLRRKYADAGLVVANWRSRPDDHFIFQLLFIAHLAQQARSDQDWKAMADFIDQHLLSWYPKFVGLIAQRSQNQFYVMLNLLTAAWAQSLRTVLAA